MAAPTYALTDRYLRDDGRVFLTGVQALARIPVEQLRADRRNGLNTAAFISGYPGSPLGGFDQEVARAAALDDALPIVCEPGVNEELGATAVMGSQLAATQPDFRYDGVLGLWYGKAPGLDRAGDALRHAAFAGTSRHGGAIALVGDDPAAKSSTLPSSSDATIYDLHMPLFYPGDVQETIDLARHAVALSRMTGTWTAMKVVAAVADGSGTVDLASDAVDIITPDLSIPGDPTGQIYEPTPNGNLLTPTTLELERDFRDIRLILAQRYATANRLNHTTADPSDAWIGLVASGYTYHELLEALRRLGLTSMAEIEAAGIRILQMQMPLSIDPQNIRHFARGVEEIVVVEEKNPTLEWLVKDALYGGPDQPRVVGKKHEDGRVLMRDHGILDAGAIVDGLRERLSPRIADRLTPATPPKREKRLLPLSVDRSPYFCSGCPHNRSTKVPDGALVGAGIGCHGMVLLMEEDKVGESAGITAMGGEGVQFIGMAPFVDRDHFIQNLGDGTFFHSGQLAIQASIAAGVNTTYKLLYNGTVAMTGGQDAVGGMGVPEIATALLAHGVREVLITTEDLDRYDGVALPSGPMGRVKVWDRTRILEAQEHLATVPGVTVLIHDQACAAQARRLRKRGVVETPPVRVAINHRICEACGHCGEVSNCLSVQPIETPLGLKTTIDQSSCNLDFSCLEGDCPSFLEITPKPGRAKKKRTVAASPGELPDPALVVPSDNFDLRMVGIGGTGVVTVAQIIATAAMLDGLHVRGLDQTGLSQKAGRVTGDLRITAGAPAPSNLIGDEGADVILGFDLLAVAGEATLGAGDPTRTILIGSISETPTGSMIGHPERSYPELDELRDRVATSTMVDQNRYVDAAALTEQLLGSTASANIFLLGFAYQHGCLPIAGTAVEEAIRLNGVAVEANLAAFAAGRSEAVAPGAGPTHTAGPEITVPDLPAPLASRADALGEAVVLRAADLLGYQNAAYVERYLHLVERVAAVGDDALTEAVAVSHHHLLAYKDEYEVARLLTGPEAQATITAVGGAGAKAAWKLHPPTLKALGMNRKIAIPTTVGSPIMKMLARGRRLRGTALDPFGRTEMRRLERELITVFESSIDTVLGRIADGSMTVDEAARIAALPQTVRGFEERKIERAAAYRAELTTALG
ncbi:MAG: indolepyruvate ferredoxin oxidoreductase family protein [Acidimicrobiales bacterium]